MQCVMETSCIITNRKISSKQNKKLNNFYFAQVKKNICAGRHLSTKTKYTPQSKTCLRRSGSNSHI